MRGEHALLNEPEWSDQVSANIADHEQKSANALGHLLENAERFLYDEVAESGRRPSGAAS